MATQEAEDLARKAMTVLEFYRPYYASGSDYQSRHAEIIGLLRHHANLVKDKNYFDFKFLMMFADTLEVSNRTGAYVPHPGITTPT